MEERKQPGYWVQVTKYPGTQGDAAGTQERKPVGTRGST
jgi:hypothetical protein